MRRQKGDHPDRFLRGHDDDEGLRQALMDGTPAAIQDAVGRIRVEEAAAPEQLRAALQP